MRRAAVALAALVVAGCGQPAPERGVVTEVDYRPAWIQVIPGVPPMCTGNPPVCTVGTPTQTIPWPDRWRVKIADSQGRSGWHDVNGAEFERCTPAAVFPECTWR